MKKAIIAIVVIALIALAIVGIVFLTNKDTSKDTPISSLKLETAEDMKNLMNNIYTTLGDTLPSLQVQEVDVSDELAVTAATGLKSKANVESVVLSEPMMSSQAYSFVLVKTSSDANVEEMKKEMLNNIDVRKWICVSAEKVYVTNYNNVICLVMASEDWAKPVYEEFKKSADGKVGQELERTEAI